MSAADLAKPSAVFADRHFDVALLGVTLPDGDGLDFGRQLLDAGIPIAITTGKHIVLPPGLEHVALMQKPYDFVVLEMTLNCLCGQVVP